MTYIFTQSQEMAKRIFSEISESFSEYVDWTRFLIGMKEISTKKITEKLDLFMKITNSDKNGMITYDEVVNLCVINLNNNVRFSEKNLDYSDLVDALVKEIYKICDTPLGESLSIPKIKKLVQDVYIF